MNKEYLTEENYQKSKKKISTIALIVLILGLLIGGSLIATGIIKSTSSQSNGRTKEVIQAEIDKINNELIPLRSQEEQEFMTNGFSEEYYRLKNEVSTREEQIRDLKDEIWENESGYKGTHYMPLYMFGAFIIIAACMISGSIYMFTKQRELLAFTAQQTMPVAQEGIEKMAPSLGKAGASITKEMAPVYGEVAKDIAKGIKEGLKEENK